MAGAEEVGPADLIEALGSQPGGLVMEGLATRGVARDALLRLPKEPSPAGEAPLRDAPVLGSEATDIVLRSADEADRLESKRIRRGHILLALLHAPVGSEAGVLVDRLGVNRSELTATLRDLITARDHAARRREPNGFRLDLPDDCPACDAPLMAEEIVSNDSGSVVRGRLSCLVCGYKLPYGRAEFAIEPASTRRRQSG
jgi:hypothetical protein